MKKIIALFLTLAMAFSLVACAAPAAAPAPAAEAAPAAEPAAPAAEPAAESAAPAAEEIKVAFITQSLANASQAYAWTQFQKYAPEYGFSVYLFEEDYDAQNGAAAIGTCIAQGFKAICINPTDPSALIPSIMEARDAGIIVGLYSSDLPEGQEANRDFMCGTDDVMCGEVAAQELMKAFPDGCKVVEVGGQSGHSAQMKRHDGFFKTIEGTNVEVLDSKDCEAWASDDAMAIMEDFIVKYGSDIQAVYCHWDVGATGCIEALKNAGMNDVYVIGVDGCSVGYDQVKEGTQALCIGQSFSQMTQDAFANITKLLNGEKCDDVTWTALDVVTKDTIDNFPYPEW